MWEKVHETEFEWTYRLKVPNGWLYRHVEMTSARSQPGQPKPPEMSGRQPHAYAVSMCFVPEKEKP